MDPLISIIIPTFNEEKTIEKTVRQFERLRTPHETIVSDSMSTDRTVEIAKSCADTVALLPASKKPGVSPARNDGVAVSHGRYLVFIDSDTFVPDPDAFFAKLLARFEREPRLVGISVKIMIVRELATRSDRAVSFLMNFWFWFSNKYFNAGLASGKFIMVKADAFRKAGGFDERLKTAEDVDLFSKLSKIGDVRTAWDLAVYHEGRRFHHMGAWMTLFKWIHNGISYWLFKKPSDTWEPVR
ncbi:MAG TPA: glycosyltransferase [Candidatus Paceibacterota bacterium]|nr:glycosyltransferase [Candidatus Paceibacterota bacterium]